MLEVPATGSTLAPSTLSVAPALVLTPDATDYLEPATTQPTTLPATQLATQPPAMSTASHVSVLVVLLGVAGLAWAVAWLSGLLRGGINGPNRMARTSSGARPLWSLPVLMAVGMFGWIFGLVAASAIGFAPKPGEPAAGIDADTIILNASAMGGAIVAMVVAYVLLRVGRLAPGLGLSIRLLPSGLLWGFLWLLVVMPTMLAASVAFSLVRSLLGYDDQVMHGLLEAMRDNPSPMVIGLGILSAVVLAPVAEELLFRGVIQTLIGSTLARLAGKATDEPAAMLPGPGQTTTADSAPSAAMRWAAIIITGLGFAVLHEAWSIPIIFLLALMLGWAYEKTGNLWVPIVIHTGFNAFNIGLLMLQVLAGDLVEEQAAVANILRLLTG